MPPLSTKERCRLRGDGHHLEPTLHVGQDGVHESLLEALEKELVAHGLVKIKVGDGSEEEAAEVASRLAAASGAELVQVIGHVILLWRPLAEAQEKKLHAKPNAGGKAKAKVKNNRKPKRAPRKKSVPRR